MPGRRRSNPLGLPKRVYFKDGSIWYVPPAGPWEKLGRAWDREARDRYRELTGSAPDRGTVAEMLDRCLDHRRQLVRDGKLAPRTLADNEIEAENLKRSFGHLLPGQVKRKHVAGYLEAGLEAGRGVRANREIAFLSSAYSWGMRKYGVEENPCYGVRRNRESPKERTPEGGELRRFGRRHAPRWLRCFILLKHLTGHRQADLLRLTRDAGTDRGLVVVEGKRGGRKRTYRWTWALRTVWRQILSLPRPGRPVASLCVFVNRAGEPMTKSGFRSAWARAMASWVAAGGERFTEHRIRARTAQDAPTLERAADLLGDNRATTARVYRSGHWKGKPLR